MKPTGGGAFDRTERPIYFAAGGTQCSGYWPDHVLVAANEIHGPQDEYRLLVSHLDAGRRVLLDSGIFNLTNVYKRKHRVSMDTALALAPEDIDGFAELYARYIGLVTRHGDRLWGAVELDQGGAANKRRTRARIEADGFTPIPVYHPLNDGWDYFDELAEQYDRICLGNIVQASRAVRVRLLYTMWERHRAHPDLWIHVLGLSPHELCHSVPVDSCDCSTWMWPLRWSTVKTESAMLRRLGNMGRSYMYDHTAEGDAMRSSYVACTDMCVTAVRSTAAGWRHSYARARQVSGPEFPALVEGEAPWR